MQDQTDDQALITRIAGQDQAALRALLGRHQLRVYRFVLRRGQQERIESLETVGAQP